MKKNNTDTFEGIKPSIYSDNNFFLMEETPELQNNYISTTEPARRLNDYDFNLLREDAYKDVSDDLFKLEYKISKTENEIKAIEAQLQSAKEIGDSTLIEDLNRRKDTLEEDYEALVAIYNEKSLSAKISDKLSNIFGGKIKNNLKIFQIEILKASEKFISKLPKQFSSIIELRKSLTKLENLNKSVNELMSMNIPYGENINKYEQLSKYIIKANSIQSEISNYIKSD